MTTTRPAAATPTQRLADLGITLPAPLPAFGEYVPAVLSGDLLQVGGHFGLREDGSAWTGKVGGAVDVEQARAAARSAALNLLATAQDALGTLDAVGQVLRVHGVVNAVPEFVEHTRVIDAASTVIVEVLGEAGRHARLAIGASSLPGDLTLEIEATLRVVPPA
jgi:enamine deaminase RidA (YjgF/YER057c/UK114 family)